VLIAASNSGPLMARIVDAARPRHWRPRPALPAWLEHLAVQEQTPKFAPLNESMAAANLSSHRLGAQWLTSDTQRELICRLCRQN